MGILSSLVYGTTAGLFDILKTQLYGRQIAGRQNEATVLKSMLESMEGMDPASPEAEAIASRVKEMTGVTWPKVEGPIRTPMPQGLSPNLGALAQGLEGQPLPSPGPLAPEMGELAKGAGVPTRSKLAGTPALGSDKLLSRALSTGDKDLVDALTGAKKGMTEYQKESLDLKKTLGEGNQDLRREIALGQQRLTEEGQRLRFDLVQQQINAAYQRHQETLELGRDKLKQSAEQATDEQTRKRLRELAGSYEKVVAAVTNAAKTGRAEDEQQAEIMINEYNKKRASLSEGYPGVASSSSALKPMTEVKGLRKMLPKAMNPKESLSGVQPVPDYEIGGAGGGTVRGSGATFDDALRAVQAMPEGPKKQKLLQQLQRYAPK